MTIYTEVAARWMYGCSKTPEEDEVTLIVQRCHLAALEAGVLVKQRSKHAPQTVPQPRVKVVQNEFWLCPGSPPMALHWKVKP